MLIFVGKFLLERSIQSADNKVAVVLVLHELLDPTQFKYPDPATFQHCRRDVLQELLILATIQILFTSLVYAKISENFYDFKTKY